jgi:redox-sensitive bicupin YhaK (pirin superfamily)
MERKIETLIPARRLIDDGDMVLYRALPAEDRISVGPFVFIDHYRHHTTRGIGDKPHPHAGIEVLSYLLEGGMEHRDSMGFRDRLEAGDAQWIRAGRGILHAEQPLGGRHGLQLWTSLPPTQKFAEPAYASYRGGDIPQVHLPGAELHVITGRVNNAQGPMVLTTPAVFAHVRLHGGATARLDVGDVTELAFYVLDGGLLASDRSSVVPGTLAILSGGEEVVLTATDHQPADVAIIGGAPAEGPILFSGPFVMDSQEHLTQAKRDYAAGRMGRLESVPF